MNLLAATLALLLTAGTAFAADTTAPSVPGQPTENSTSDQDYDTDGKYTVYWNAAKDSESGIAAYELQERAGTAGSWATLTSTTTGAKFSVSGRQQGTRYFYRARAKNGVGLWSAWSLVSDGILVDKTAPTVINVNDDGAVTSSTTTLHATWEASDPESGIAEYQYTIRRDSPTGSTVVSWTSAGTATGVTKSGLTLALGTTYYFGVRARNQAGLYSLNNYSNGITVRANSAPSILSVSPAEGTPYTEGDSVQVNVTALDPEGDALEYQFLMDGVVKRPWSAALPWIWETQGFPKTHQLTVQVRDPFGLQVEKTEDLFGYRKPKGIPL